MAKKQNQKLKILWLMKILLRETDDKHGLTMQELLDKLDDKGVSAERKSIYDDINLLHEFGIDIVVQKGQTAKYYISSREFEHPELTLLVDAVSSSKSLTVRKSNELVKKLEKLTSIHQLKSLKKQIHIFDRIKVQNESIYYNVDAIQQGINLKKRISFKYYDYDIEKNSIARKNGQIYTVNPIALTYANEYYYLITYNDFYDNIANYRVDRMKFITVTDIKAAMVPKVKNFNLEEYCQYSFSMFGGEEIHVQFQIDKSLINSVIDRFGKDVNIHKIDENIAIVYTTISKSNVFFGWVTQFGESIKIIKPESLAKEYKGFLKKIIKFY